MKDVSDCYSQLKAKSCLKTSAAQREEKPSIRASLHHHIVLQMRFRNITS